MTNSPKKKGTSYPPIVNIPPASPKPEEANPLKFEHTVGSHSDDRGGDSDRRCDCQDKAQSSPQPVSIEDLDQILTGILTGAYWKQRQVDDNGELRTVREIALSKLTTLIATKEQEAIDNEQGRYCGVCFLPCYEHGGWKCEQHGYKSAYISKQEASECRAAQLTINKGEPHG